ncbi:MAG: MBL fold metallo-hydrolase, partial [Alphaproteobacteria bacterium]
MQFNSGDWRIDVLIQGYPGKSTEHGGLGWSTVALLRGHGRIVVLDGGGYGMRKPLVEALGKQGVKLSDVTDLLVSHLHHDHVVNWPMFRDARIHVGRKEL